MLVVGDLDDTFLPQPQDLLLNINECREGIESLLRRFNDMFQSKPAQICSHDSRCIGSMADDLHPESEAQRCDGDGVICASSPLVLEGC